MKTYYFVRHGASTADSGEMELDGVNAPATVEDIPLSDMGKDEAVRAADFFERLGNIEGVYSSPLIRTYDTAKIIGDRLGLEVKTLPEVKEVDLSGLLNFFKKGSGKMPVKIGPKDLPLDFFRGVMAVTGSAFFLLWRLIGNMPDTERPDEAKARLESAFSILDSVAEQRIVVVSHGFFIQFMTSYFVMKDAATLSLLRGRMWVPNCSVTKVTSTRGNLAMKYFARGDYEHIR